MSNSSDNQKILDHSESSEFNYGSNENINTSSRRNPMTSRVANGHVHDSIRDFSDIEHRGSSSYVEFLGGSVPCPTCRGVGSISKGTD